MPLEQSPCRRLAWKSECQKTYIAVFPSTIDKNDAYTAPPDMGGADMDSALSTLDPKEAQKIKDDLKNSSSDKIIQPQDQSFEGLMANLPLTPEKLEESNNLIAVSLFDLAKLYQTGFLTNINISHF